MRDNIKGLSNRLDTILSIVTAEYVKNVNFRTVRPFEVCGKPPGQIKVGCVDSSEDDNQVGGFIIRAAV